MEIKYFGHASFQILSKIATLITDPFDPAMVGLKFPAASADVVTISHDHGDHNAAKQVEGNPLVFSLPGEYEVKGIRIHGFPTFHDDKQGKDRGANIIFKYVVDDISVLHCGDLGHHLSEELLEEIGAVQVLLVPVGGVYTIGVDEAVKLVAQLEPSIVIPMHYKTPKHEVKAFSELATVEDFIKKMGMEATYEKKLTLKTEGLTDGTKLIVLEDL